MIDHRWSGVGTAYQRAATAGIVRIADKLIEKGERSASGLVLVLDRYIIIQIIKEVLNA